MLTPPAVPDVLSTPSAFMSSMKRASVSGCSGNFCAALAGWSAYGPVTGVFSVVHSFAVKKCSLSLMIGPPSEKPVCERLNGWPRTAAVSAP